MKIKVSEFRDRSFEYTSKSSDIIRQLILAGVAIIWLFKDKNKNELDHFAIYPLAFLAGAALLDLIQYVAGGLIWILEYYKQQNLHNRIDDEVEVPEQKSFVIWLFWGVKILLTLTAYVFIIIFLLENLRFVSK
jgi:hypothetical protein